MRLTFFGAAGEVTGSNILVESGNVKILLDCGIFQGFKLAEERNYSPIPYDPKTISAIVIGHAHLDHTGKLPRLVREGFRGRIYSTAPTCELARLVLEDNAKLMLEEAQRENHSPLYTNDDIDRVMQLFETLPYGKELEIAEGVKLTLRNAGHILGSAITCLEIEGKKLVYTSDLGNNPSELLPSPEVIESADYVICESTYGGRVHEDIKKRQEKLNAVISRTISQDGVLMIPSFAIERTQELLHDIEHFCTTNSCALPTFYLDSPLAEKVTRVFEKYVDYLKPGLVTSHNPDSIFGLSRLHITTSVGDSKKINESLNPKIIIAGSGMLNGGRILFHLQRYISDIKNTLLIVGYQSQGTLGRRLLDGESEIKIFGKPYHVEAKVLAIGSYSAHADSIQLLSWLGQIKNLKKIFLVHGEANQSLALKEDVQKKLNTDSIIPQLGETYDL